MRRVPAKRCRVAVASPPRPRGGNCIPLAAHSRCVRPVCCVVLRRYGSKRPTMKKTWSAVCRASALPVAPTGLAAWPRAGRAGCCKRVSSWSCPAAKPCPRRKKPASLPVFSPRLPPMLRLSRGRGFPAATPAAPPSWGGPVGRFSLCPSFPLYDQFMLDPALFLPTCYRPHHAPQVGRYAAGAVCYRLAFSCLIIPALNSNGVGDDCEPRYRPLETAPFFCIAWSLNFSKR